MSKNGDARLIFDINPVTKKIINETAQIFTRFYIKLVILHKQISEDRHD